MELPTYQDLNDEQLDIYSLPLDGNYLVSGPPGTGKTVMGIYRAQMYSEFDIETHVIQYNNTLDKYTSGAFDELNVECNVETFYSWIWNEYPERVNGDRPPDTGESFSYDWKNTLSELLKSDVKKVEVLLMDEGQDLPNGFYSSLPHLAERFTVFADENQRLNEEKNSTLDEIRQAANPDDELRLTKNHRNTKEIARLAREFYVGLETGVPDLPDRRGEKPVVKRTRDFEAAAEFIARFERTNNRQRIGVLFKNAQTQLRMYRLLRSRNTENSVEAYSSASYEDIDTLNFSSPGLQVLCFASAKGLEFDTVFLPEIQTYSSDVERASTKMELYVMVSRARDQLFVMYSGTDEPPVLDLFPEELIEKR